MRKTLEEDTASHAVYPAEQGRRIVYTIHYNVCTVCSAMKLDLTACSVDTLSNNLIACGDINIPSVSGRYFEYASPVPIANTDAGLDHHPRFNGIP